MIIKTLIKRVEREAKPDRFDNACVSFSREDASENYSSLRRATRDESVSYTHLTLPTKA